MRVGIVAVYGVHGHVPSLDATLADVRAAGEDAAVGLPCLRTLEHARHLPTLRANCSIDMNPKLTVPDARDGLRPVERRLFRVMHTMNGAGDRPFRRSSSIVGEVRQRFPGQGWRSAYDALVRMAQGFMLRYPLADGEGNFGSIDGDPAAAPSYTNARLTDFGAAMLSDGRSVSDARDVAGEADALPSRVPNLLVNGASTTSASIPPHNLHEVVSALTHLIDHPNMTGAAVRDYIKGPDFPTGGCIRGVDGIRNYQETGRGQIIMRARAEIETLEVTRIVLTEVPFHMDASWLISTLADAVRDGRIHGVSDLRNESDRDGLRITITPKPGVDAQELLDALYERTPMQSALPVALVALVPDAQTGQLVPRTLSLLELLKQYLAYRDECIARDISAGAEVSSKAERMEVLKAQLVHVAAAFGDRRRTEILEA